MIGIYFVPITNGSKENYNRYIKFFRKEIINILNNEKNVSLKKEFNEISQNNYKDMGLWSFSNNQGSNNRSYWEQMKVNDLVLFFNREEKLVSLGRVHRKFEENLSVEEAESLFNYDEAVLAFILKDIAIFKESHVLHYDIGKLFNYDIKFPRGVLKVSEHRYDEEIINKVYELILLNTVEESRGN